jgi:hypothetical protein
VRKVVKHFSAEKERTRAWRKILEQATPSLLRQSRSTKRKRRRRTRRVSTARIRSSMMR